MNEDNSDYSFMWRYPRLLSHYCSADHINALIIGADGRLYKCWKDIGNHKNSIGSVIENIEANENLYLNYMLFDPTTNTMCSGCNLLPVCMGGCPHTRVNGDTDKCSIYSHILKSYLGVITNKLEKQYSAK